MVTLVRGEVVARKRGGEGVVAWVRREVVTRGEGEWGAVVTLLRSELVARSKGERGAVVTLLKRGLDGCKG